MAPRALSAVLGAALCAALGCAPPPSARPTAGAPPANYRAPTRSGPECAEVIARALAGRDTAGMQKPIPGLVPMPPYPIPYAVRGQTAELDMLVDEQGVVPVDSVRVSGLGGHAYARKLQQMTAGFRFHPAVMEGCAVPFRVLLRMTL